jgi:hypothetical protein
MTKFKAKGDREIDNNIKGDMARPKKEVKVVPASKEMHEQGGLDHF